MQTIIKSKQYGYEIILANSTSEAGAKIYRPPIKRDIEGGEDPKAFMEAL
jgi:hypothetical protein